MSLYLLIFLFLLLAFLIGFFTGYYLGKLRKKEPFQEKIITSEEIAERFFLTKPNGEKDDLKEIWGIARKLEKTLNSLGIFHLYQIASMNEEQKSYVNEFLNFNGRIDRDDWIGQATELLEKRQRE